MFILSAFADEIGPDPRLQIDVLKSAQVRFIEFRSIHGTNVLALSDAQLDEFKKMLDGEGFGISAIGSPVGKVPIDAPFEPHLDKYKRAIELAKKFDTLNIRVFSYYPPEGGPEDGWQPKFRSEVIDRMAKKAEMAQEAGVRMIHENEHRIYGDSPERLKDLLSSVNSPALGQAYDAANFVFCGYDPVEGWEASKDHVIHFHIKDWKSGEAHGCLAGHGDGQMVKVTADAVARGYDGFATLEPHLRGGGPTGGVTGPDLFPVAVEAFREVMRQAGASEKS